MDEYDFSGLLTQISQIRPARALGRVRSVDGTVIWVRGLAHLACIGDRVRLFRGGGALDGEVLRIRDDLVAMLPDEGPEGVSQGDRVAVLGPPVLAPSEAWIGRVIDPYGQPLDGVRSRRGRGDGRFVPARRLRRSGAGSALGCAPDWRRSIRCCRWCGANASACLPGPAWANRGCSRVSVRGSRPTSWCWL